MAVKAPCIVQTFMALQPQPPQMMCTPPAASRPLPGFEFEAAPSALFVVCHSFSVIAVLVRRCGRWWKRDGGLAKRPKPEAAAEPKRQGASRLGCGCGASAGMNGGRARQCVYCRRRCCLHNLGSSPTLTSVQLWPIPVQRRLATRRPRQHVRQLAGATAEDARAAPLPPGRTPSRQPSGARPAMGWQQQQEEQQRQQQQGMLTPLAAEQRKKAHRSSNHGSGSGGSATRHRRSPGSRVAAQLQLPLAPARL